MTAHKIHGNSFALIAKMVPGRTDVRPIVCVRPGCVCARGMCSLLSPACMDTLLHMHIERRQESLVRLARPALVCASFLCL